MAPITLWIFCIFLLLTGCYKDYLYVQQEWIDPQFLASSKIGTPDPRQEKPFFGQRLIIAWDFPKSFFSRDLHLLTTVRFWDNKEEVFQTPILRKRDITAFFFPNPDKTQDRHILTYQVQVFAKDGTLMAKWEHHFWTKLIDVGSSLEEEESVSSADKINS